MLIRPGIATVKHRLHITLMVAVITLGIAGCTPIGGQESTGTSTGPTSDAEASSSAATPELNDRAPCEDGKLLISDLAHIDDQWEAGLAISNTRAADWHEDSRLVEFRVSCGLFESGFRWQATYYSAEAQAVYAADTRESSPIDVESEALPSLDLTGVSFARLREALLSIDYAGSNELEPSTGVDIRVNSTGLPFGPPEVPIGSTIAHVSIDFRGEIKDLFITTETSDIFQFSSPSS